MRICVPYEKHALRVVVRIGGCIALHARHMEMLPQAERPKAAGEHGERTNRLMEVDYISAGADGSAEIWDLRGTLRVSTIQHGLNG